MTLPEFSIHRPVTVLMGTLILILLGGIAFVNLPVDLMPEMVYPTVSVRAEYPGVAPEEMENLVARPLEEAFASAPGVEEITSTSMEGTAFVRVNFTYGTNLDEAVNELRIRLDRRRSALPEDMQPPTMYKYDVSQFPIMFLTVSATDMGPRELRYFVEKKLQYRMERVPGVAQFTVRGGLRREIHVDLDLDKLRALDLSVARVVQIVRQENLNRPVGPVREGRFEVLLRTQGEFQNLDQIRNLVLTTRRGVPVYMKDVALVEDSHEEVRQLVSVNGNPAVRLFVNKQSGFNTVQVCEGVWEEIARIHKEYPNIRITATGDSSQFIKAAINNVKDAAWQGGLLAVMILLVFLRSLSSTIIIGVAIPVSVISTFALMHYYGFTLNTVSFGGLALGVGMLVDNAIVVLENIFRHREEGKSPIEAAVIGSKEVAMPITASTLTTLAVFVPVVFMQGMSAVTFKQLAYVVSFSLLCSLTMALTLVPVMCSRYLRVGRLTSEGGFSRWLGSFHDRMDASYGNLLRWATLHRKTVVFSAAALFAGALLVAPVIGVELMPEPDEGEINVDVELEPGTRVEVTHEVMERLGKIIRQTVPEVENIMIESGSGGGFSRSSGQHMGELRIRLVEQKLRTRKAREIVAALRPRLMVQPGMVVRTRVSSGMYRRGTRSGSGGGGGGGSDRLQVEVRGHDLAVLQNLAQQVAKIMASVEGVPDVQISRRPGMPEMLLTVDRIKAATMGLNVSDIADAMETAVGGRRTSMYRQQGDEYNILVRLQEKDRLQLSQVGKVPFSTPLGQTIPAESVVRMRRQEGPVSIDRADQERIIIVSGTLGDRDLGSVMRELDAKIQQIPRPAGVEFKYGGEYEEQQKTFRELMFAAILALILVYMVMASQFRSLLDPFIIMFSVPLGLIGVVWALFLTHTTLSVTSFMGIIMMVGIVVSNGVLLVEYINELRRRGQDLHAAVVLASRTRLRPILMTTLTTLVGLFPMALGLDVGSEANAPLARAVIGGLAVSTVLTLVLIPTLYVMIEERFPRRAAEAEPAWAARGGSA
jgi:HAE1 family hydrophobic/amphiphilic exporter-1